MEENDELTSPGLQKLLFDELNMQFSLRTINRARYKIGWRKSGPRYCQIVREANRVKRLEFARKCAAENEKFENIVFTDESSIWSSRHSKLCFRKVGQPAKMKPTAKHPFKVHVWAGISTKGATPVLLFSGIMDRFFYVEEILKNSLLPFVNATFPDNNYRFQQDNDPKHTSRLAKQFLADNNANYWPTPAESPDLNPIVMLWHELKCFLRHVVKPSNKEELIRGIKQFWDGVTPAKCEKYFNHLQKVIPAIISREGRASGH